MSELVNAGHQRRSGFKATTLSRNTQLDKKIQNQFSKRRDQRTDAIHRKRGYQVEVNVSVEPADYNDMDLKVHISHGLCLRI